jgi:aminopeptidase N
MQNSAGTDPYFPTHGNVGYSVDHYDLALEYRPTAGRLSGRATLQLLAATTLDAFSLDLGSFKIEHVNVNGHRAKYTHRDDKLRVRPGHSIPAGTRFTVDVRYVGTPKPVRSYWGDLGWEHLDDGALVASQPIGAPSWFPCNDRPADKARYRISVSAPSSLAVVANGVLVSRKVGAGASTWVYEHDSPMSTYLATVLIGPYELVDLSSETVPQRAAVPARLREEFTHDFGRQDEMLMVFERLFGPYPFDEYTVVVVDEELDVPVEAQALSIFGRNHVDGRRGSQRFVAHELAHQWFGNSLTVADWRHIWLNEGFANYAEWLWSEFSGGEPAAAHAARWRAKLAQLPQDLRIGDPGARRMFDDRVYRRGALTLHALRTTIGEGEFFDLLREWTATQRHATVTTEQFTALAQRHASTPLAGLFAAWLHDPRLPALPVAPSQ